MSGEWCMNWKETDEGDKEIILKDNWDAIISTRTLMSHFDIDYEKEIRLLKKEQQELMEEEKRREYPKVESSWDLL